MNSKRPAQALFNEEEDMWILYQRVYEDMICNEPNRHPHGNVEVETVGLEQCLLKSWVSFHSISANAFPLLASVSIYL